MRGFTLVEIAIVLVIIGLLTGGILFGRDLIEASKIRNAVTQVQEIRTALNTFKSKYNGLPGDLSPVTADGLGFEMRDGQDGNGDADGLIEGCDGNAFPSSQDIAGCENVLAWRDLSDAKMIPYSFTVGVADFLPDLTAADMPQYFPTLQQFQDTYMLLYSKPDHIEFVGGGKFGFSGRNIIVFTGLRGTYNDSTFNETATLNARQAQAIDAKMDDGLPLSGNVHTITSASTGIYDMGVASSVCYQTGGVLNIYPVQAAHATRPLCKMIFVH